MPRRRFLNVAVAVLALGGLAYGGQAGFSSSDHETYLVHAGDSLWSIALAHHVTMQQLAAANGMKLTDVLLIGRTLVIPDGSTPRPAAPIHSPTTHSRTSQSASTQSAATSGALATTAPSIACADPPGAGPYGVPPLMSTTEAQLRPLFVEWADDYGVSPALIEAIAWQESGWQEGVVSRAHAVGIGQLIPATAAFVSQDLIGTALDVHSASDNIRMMARFVAYLEAREDGNLCDTIAAYYEGPANLVDHGIFRMSVPYIADVKALIPRFE